MTDQRNGRPWTDVALAAGAQNAQDAEGLLWSGTAFPFAATRTIWHQLRHVIRHKVCYDNPEAQCGNKRCAP